MAHGPIEGAKNRAHELLADSDAALRDGKISEAQWHERVDAVITPAYLGAPNPRAQSGHSGDEAAWRHARSLILDLVDRDGTFLDIGCATGHLMESLAEWSTDVRIDPYGLELSAPLAELARTRLPQWADRIYEGNAINWMPPRRYSFVRTGLEYVPQRRRRDLVEHLMTHAVAPGGRLLVGVYNEEPSSNAVAQSLEQWGYAIAGRAERDHRRDARIRYKVVAIDNPAV
jgi:SAM-dependent methyltransferase